jgi:hypothetical protein
MTTTQPPVRAGRASGLRGWAQVLGVIALLLGAGEAIRWGNRAYIAFWFFDDPELAAYRFGLAQGAQEALVRALVLLAVGAVLVAIGWRLRIVRAR